MSVEQVVLANDDIELTILPGVGARMHGLRYHGVQLLRAPVDIREHLTEPFFWGGYVMAPWCNRVTPGPVTVLGKTVDLVPNFRDGSAIHGQVYDAPWQRTGDSSFAIEQGGHGGWPWRYRVEAEYGIAGQQLALTLRLRNLSESDMPGGIGVHPWFPTPVEIGINSGLTYGPNNDTHATPQPVRGDLDLRTQQTMREGVDATWAEPADPAAELFWPAHGLRAALRAAAPTLHITAAYAPERGAIAVEPQTHAPQGLWRLIERQPGALAVIPAGGELTLPITLDFSPSA